MPASNSGTQRFSPTLKMLQPQPQQSRTSPRPTTRPYSVDEICADGTPGPPLKIGDKIVWISDNGPEPGVVKWLGKLPDIGHDWMAGVDFVNPVGSGTGLYNERRLFDTKLNHASLVPIVGLIKETDFHGNLNSLANPLLYDTIAPPQKPKRTKKLDNSRFYVSNEENIEPMRSPPESITTISEKLADVRLMDTENEYPSKMYSVAKPPHSPKAETSNESSFNVSRFSNISPVKPTTSDFETRDKQNGTTENHEQAVRDRDKDDELFEIGSVVEVPINQSSYHGVIRWLGFLKNDQEFRIDSIRKSDKHFKSVVAGIELEEEISGLTDGTLNGRRYFSCAMNKAYFISLAECTKDRRFCSSNRQANGASSVLDGKPDSSLFGSIDCPTVLGDVPPLTSKDLDRLCGKNRGIQGHHNSCYLDATLFAMFSFSTIFESLLNRPKRPNDIPEYNEVQRVLKEEIVNPLRANLYVRADRVMHFRQLLEKISSVRGLTSEEKDPEEFINLLLNEILKTDPYLKLSSGLESLFYQLFIEKDQNLQIPTVQQLFDQSFLASDIKLREVPPCLMIQMPRFGRDFKMYSRIVPTLYLDITNVLDNSPRQCIICGQLAQYECKECFGKFCEGLDSIAFCGICLDKTHSHKKRIKHKTTKLNIPPDFALLQDHTNIPRVVMELFAVLCIETSHYVCFVKCGNEPESPWCFFDSMADRKGEQDGYNIPEVIAFPYLKWWLTKEGFQHLLNIKDEKMIPELPRRLFCDAYICFYTSETSKYR